MVELNPIPADPVTFIYHAQNTHSKRLVLTDFFSLLLGLFRFSMLMKLLVAPFTFFFFPLSSGPHAPSVFSTSFLLPFPHILSTALCTQNGCPPSVPVSWILSQSLEIIKAAWSLQHSDASHQGPLERTSTTMLRPLFCQLGGIGLTFPWLRSTFNLSPG